MIQSFSKNSSYGSLPRIFQSLHFQSFLGDFSKGYIQYRTYTCPKTLREGENIPKSPSELIYQSPISPSYDFRHISKIKKNHPSPVRSLKRQSIQWRPLDLNGTFRSRLQNPFQMSSRYHIPQIFDSQLILTWFFRFLTSDYPLVTF